MPIALALTMVLAASAPDAGQEPLKVRVLYGNKPAPPETEVRLFEPSILCGNAQDRTAPRRNPDAQGWVEFPAPRRTFAGRPSGPSWVHGEHPALGRISMPADDASRTLTFPEGEPLAGQVLDDQGRPAAGATVFVTPAEPALSGVLVETATGVSALAIRSRQADASGHFAFLGLRKGLYAVAATATGVQTLLSPATQTEAGRRDVLVRLTRRFRVTGQVVDHAGQPISGARVRARLAPNAPLTPRAPSTSPPTYRFEQLFEPAPSTTNPQSYSSWADTDTDGGFWLPVGVPGPIALEVYGDCFSLAGAVASGDETFAWRAPPTASVRGTLASKGATPATRVELVLLPDEGFDGRCSRFTQSVDVVDGVFRMSGLPAVSGRLSIAAAGFAPATRAIRVKAGGALELGPVTLTHGASLAGVVRSPSGAPVAGITVSVFGSAIEMTKATTDTTGAFALSNLAPSRVDVLAIDSGDSLEARKVLTLTEGRTSNVKLVLAPPAP